MIWFVIVNIPAGLSVLIPNLCTLFGSFYGLCMVHWNTKFMHTPWFILCRSITQSFRAINLTLGTATFLGSGKRPLHFRVAILDFGVSE